MEKITELKFKIKTAFKPPPNPNKDAVQKIIGTFGKYHLWLCFIVFISKIPIAYHQMAIIFLAPHQPFICKSTGKMECPCPDPEYDKSVFSSTIISQWNLICERKWLTSFSQTLFQLGTLIGSIVFGMLSDRFGRKYPMIMAVILQFLSGVVAAFMPEYWTFTLTRFVTGLTVGGTMVIGFVLVMEYIGTEYRDVVAALYQTPFNLGHLMLPLIGHLTRNYFSFQLATSLPIALLLAYICLLPESPRWLMAVNKTEPAIILLEHVAKINNRPTDHIRDEIERFQNEKHESELKKGTVLDLFRTPNIRKNTLCMGFNWLSCSYCFYGVSQYVGQLSGNMFTNVACSALVALMGALLTIPLLKLTGRRTIVRTFSGVCAACLLLLIAMPDGGLSVMCACVGVISSFIVFGTVYLYCGEMFPTVVRNAALGFSSMMARVGSMIAPFVVGMKDDAEWLPPLLFAILPLIAVGVTFLMPETKGRDLMTTIAEGEQFGKNTPEPETEPDAEAEPKPESPNPDTRKNP